jgi:hypothetical protein
MRTARQSGCPRAAATRPPSVLWRLFGAIQPPARCPHPDATPAGCGRARGQPRGTALDLGAAAQAGVCTRYGALSLVSTGGAAHHRRHHARRGDPEDPPASEAFRRPAPDCSDSWVPHNFRLVCRLRCPVARPVGGEVWLSCVVAPQRVPLLPRCRTPRLASVLYARTC